MNSTPTPIPFFWSNSLRDRRIIPDNYFVDKDSDTPNTFKVVFIPGRTDHDVFVFNGRLHEFYTDKGSVSLDSGDRRLPLFFDIMDPSVHLMRDDEFNALFASNYTELLERIKKGEGLASCVYQRLIEICNMSRPRSMHFLINILEKMSSGRYTTVSRWPNEFRP